MGEPIRHPDQERVKNLVEKILKNRRKTADWSVQMMEYEFLRGMYRVRLSLEENTVVANLPAELIDETVHGDNQSRRRIQHALRDAVKSFYDLQDED